MNKVRIADVEKSVQPAAVMQHLTKPLGLTDFAINYYELEPGDSFAFAYHNHEVQEEVFYIQPGTATFDTADGPIEVEAGEIIRFDREEFQRGWNRGTERYVPLHWARRWSTADRENSGTARRAARRPIPSSNARWRMANRRQ